MLNKLFIILIVAAALSSCATYKQVPHLNEPSDSYISKANIVAVEPFNVTLIKSPITLIQLGKESESQDITISTVLNNVRVLVRSPRALTKYSITEKDLPVIIRDGFADFLTNEEKYDYNLFKGWSVLQVSNYSKDPENQMNITNSYSVELLDKIGQESSADIVIGGNVEIEATIVRVTDRSDDTPTTNIAKWHKPDSYLFVSEISYTIDIKSSESGKILKSYSEPSHSLTVPLQFETSVEIPYQSKKQVLDFLDTDEYQNIVKKSISNYMVRFIPTFKKYITHTRIKVEE